MKTLEYLTEKNKLKVWLRAFRIWQQKPHRLAPLSEDWNECASCGMSYQGNYCPRCGQSARVGRFSFKNTFLLVLDVWGIGNRSMFRSLRDLMLRPGYMIHDYLRGMQSAYFPPFKMFFLLTAFSFLIDNGLGLNVDELEEEAEETKELIQVQKKENKERTITLNGKEVNSPLYKKGVYYGKMMNRLKNRNPALFSFLFLILFSLPLYFFIHKSPKIPDLRYSEFIVALVYTSNTFSIYSIMGNLGIPVFKLVAILMVFITLRQLTGFTRRRLFGYVILTLLVSSIAMVAMICAFFYAVYLTVQ